MTLVKHRDRTFGWNRFYRTDNWGQVFMGDYINIPLWGGWSLAFYPPWYSEPL
jgi:hypothetical protein